MEDCCCPAVSGGRLRPCPRCLVNGTVVELQTVKALLTERALARLAVAHHRFCSNDMCDVVYFDDEGGTFDTSDIRVPVWQKARSGGGLICYCFGETETSVRTEMERTGRSGAVQRVRAHIAARRCACDIRNPRGSCCLGDLTAAVQRLQSAAPKKGM
jgi:hypothetical protein